jgi:hypothetical protein
MLRRGRGNENTPADDRRRLSKVAGTLEADGKAAMTKQARAESSSPGERFLTLSEAAEVLRFEHKNRPGIRKTRHTRRNRRDGWRSAGY